MAIKNVPLIMAKARVAELAERERAHKEDCTRPRGCEELAEIRAELKEARREVAAWFAPGEDQESLF